MSDAPLIRKSDRLAALGFSISGHLGAFLAVAMMRAAPVMPPEPPPVMATLIELPGPPVLVPSPAPPAPPTLDPPQPAPPAAAPPKPSPLPVRKAERAPPPQVATLAAGEETPVQADVWLRGAQLAGAATAGSGGGGRGCDMIQFLQTALRKDSGIRDALVEAHRVNGRPDGALLVWDRDWLRSRGQDGKGLARLREAILVEVAFAPAACREDPVQGPVVISLNDAPGAARLAIGSGRWRWSDLLFPPRG